MYAIKLGGKEYVFTDRQQWLDNETFCVIATCDSTEYQIEYDAPDIDEPENIDWENPYLIERLSDGEVAYRQTQSGDAVTPQDTPSADRDREK